MSKKIKQKQTSKKMDYQDIYFMFIKFKYDCLNLKNMKFFALIVSSFFFMIIFMFFLIKTSENKGLILFSEAFIIFISLNIFIMIVFYLLRLFYKFILSFKFIYTNVDFFLFLLILLGLYKISPYINKLFEFDFFTNILFNSISEPVIHIIELTLLLLFIPMFILICLNWLEDYGQDFITDFFNKNKKISNFFLKFNCYFLVSEFVIFLLITPIIIVLVSLGFSTYIMPIIMIIFSFYFVMKLVLINSIKKSLNVNYYNSFVDSNITSRSVFIDEKYDNLNLKTFKLSINKKMLVKDIYDLKLVSIDNFYCVNGDSEIIDNEILFSINSNILNSSDIVYLQLYVSVLNNDKTKATLKIKLQVKFEKHDDLIFPSSLGVLNITKVRKRINLSSLHNVSKDESVKLYSKIIPNLLCIEPYNSNNYNTTSTAKFSIQNGAFGQGKTTYSIVNLLNDGFLPIIISTWEDNMSNDLLYSIYQKLKNISNRKRFPKLAKKTKVIFWAGYAVVLNLLVLICTLFGSVNNYDLNLVVLSRNFLFYYSKLDNSNLELFLNASIILFVLYVLGLILQRFIYPFLCDDVITYKNNFDTYYREQLIDEICFMMNKNQNYMLLIEDIDRLEVEEINKVFRDISFINRRLNNCSKCRGIISFDLKLMHKMFLNYEVKNNLILRDKKIKESKILSDILNKITYKSILDVTNDAMLTTYKDKSMKYVNSIYTGSVTGAVLMKKFKKSNDFRKVKDSLIEVINDRDKHNQF